MRILQGHHEKLRLPSSIILVWAFTLEVSAVSSNYSIDGCLDCSLSEMGNDDWINIEPGTTSPTNLVDGASRDEEVMMWGAIDILVSIFFLLAAGWLLMAIVYSVLILILLRLQARGELDFYDEDFGLFRFGRLHIHCGCILRRYAIQLDREQQRRRQRQFGDEPRPVRIMTRDERHQAIDRLLQPNKEVLSHILPSSDGFTEENGPICTICLTECVDSVQIFVSDTCSHCFHRDCIMEWLERRANIECPCCREPMVSDEDVWEEVKRLRKLQRQGMLEQRNRFLPRLSRWSAKCFQASSTELESNDDVTTPSSNVNHQEDATPDQEVNV